MAGKGAPPGQRYGGRQKGSVNKRSQTLVEQLEALGLNPVAELVAASNRARDEGDITNWIAANKSLMPFLYPRRRAVDITTNAEPLRVEIVTGVPHAEEPSDVLDRLNRALEH